MNLKYYEQLAEFEKEILKYEDKLIEKTGHSAQQVKSFFNLLADRLDELHISSLDDLLVRYESINSFDTSERENLLKEVVGLFHLNLLKELMSILENNTI